MTILPASFRAYVVDKSADGSFSRGLRGLTPADLPPGELTVRVEWSSVNFKDGLAARADGKVARVYPLVAGIDLAGRVVASDDDAFPVGSRDRGQRLRHRHGAPRRLRRAGAHPVGLGGPAPAGADDTRRDGDRHGGLHGGDERRRARAPRPEARRRTGAGDRRRRWGGLDRDRDPRGARLRGLGRHRQGGRGRSPAGPRCDGVPDPRRGDRSRPAARVDALGGRRRHGGLGDAPVRAADHAPGGDGRVERQRLRRRASHDGVPVHPARGRAPRDGQCQPADRAAAVALGTPGGRPAAARHRGRDHRGGPRHA